MILDVQDNRFLACADCRTLIPLWCEAELGDFGDSDVPPCHEFTAEHHTHELVELRRTDTEPVNEGPLWDPMVRVHIELTDGDRLYVATASRASIEEERIYTLRSCSLRTISSAVDIADNDVRRGLDLEFFPNAIRPTKIDDFLDALRNAIRDLATENLEIAYVDADDPAVSIAPMPEEALQRVLLASSKIFDPSEFPLVERFLRENRQETGVLALRVRRNTVVTDD